jgi:uncharacterized membrane protein
MIGEMTAGQERDLDRSIGRLLTVGTYLGVAALAVGTILQLAAGISPLQADWPAFDPAAIPAGLVALRPDAYLWLGLMIVIATPIARVAAALVAFVVARDTAMVVVAAGILVVIAAGVTLGIAGA